MARTVGKLTALKVGRELPAGMHPDGAGLYLHVSASGAKSWIYRYSIRGKAREMGIGSLSAVSLAEARDQKPRSIVRFAKREQTLSKRGMCDTPKRRLRTLGQLRSRKRRSDTSTPNVRAGKMASTRRNGRTTLSTYVYPIIGALSVQAIDTPLICKVLEPIWTKKTETANRVRGRIETILDWAKARGLREGDNPARWRGHLEFDLPRVPK